MSSENSINMSIGTVIALENVDFTTQPIDIMSLEFEDIFLSNCEDYWLEQFDEDGPSTITSPNGAESISQTSSALFSSENETTSQTSGGLFSTVNGFVIGKNASSDGFSDEASGATDAAQSSSFVKSVIVANSPMTAESELCDPANMGCFEPTECMEVEDQTESATITVQNKR